MAKYKIGGLSFNEGDDSKKEKKKGMLKSDIAFTFDTPLDSLSLDGIFNTNPIVEKKESINKVKEINLSPRKKKKKGNELI